MTTGHLWIFSTSHGRSRPSYIHRSKKPHDIDEFELVEAVSGRRKTPINNFSYFQIWNGASSPSSTIPGFFAFYTHYNDPADRTLLLYDSADGYQWSSPTRLAAIEKGHYQISGRQRQKARFDVQLSTPSRRASIGGRTSTIWSRLDLGEDLDDGRRKAP